METLTRGSADLLSPSAASLPLTPYAPGLHREVETGVAWTTNAGRAADHFKITPVARPIYQPKTAPIRQAELVVEGTQEEVEALIETMNDWIRFAQHGENWDDQGAHAPTFEAKRLAAWVIIESWKSSRKRGSNWLIPIAVLPMPDGGALLEWENDGQAVEITVRPSGHYRMLKLHNGSVSYVTPRGELESFSEVQSSILRVFDHTS